MSVHSEIGPDVRTGRWEVYEAARKIAALAQIAAECASDGPRQDMPRARQVLARIRQLSGADLASDDAVEG